MSPRLRSSRDVAMRVAAAPSGPAIVANPTTLVWQASGQGTIATPGENIEVIDGGGTRRAIYIGTSTRQNSAQGNSLVRSPGTTSLGNAAFIGAAYTSRCQAEWRSDQRTFADGDHYYLLLVGSSDVTGGGVCLRLPAGWTVGQTASGVATTLNPSASFASPVASGAYVLVGIHCLFADSVVTAPLNGVLLGTSSVNVNRTQRVYVYGLGTMVGKTTVPAATMSGSVPCTMSAFELLPP